MKIKIYVDDLNDFASGNAHVEKIEDLEYCFYPDATTVEDAAHQELKAMGAYDELDELIDQYSEKLWLQHVSIDPERLAIDMKMTYQWQESSDPDHPGLYKFYR